MKGEGGGFRVIPHTSPDNTWINFTHTNEEGGGGWRRTGVEVEGTGEEEKKEGRSR